jgi:DNA-binding response OmpR family regulator
MRVLVAEDEPLLADNIADGLRRRSMAVDVCYDGDAALERVTTHRYDIVILDRDLPHVHGDEVCRRIVAEGGETRVLMLTAASGIRDRVDGLDLGADDYLTKPFSYVVLAARLRALLRRGAQPRPVQLQAGDLTLDPGTRQVRRGETVIDLTPREFALLEYLMRQAGQVVSKTSLLEHVWDAYDSVDPNVVEVYAGYLRRKIDNPFGRRALQTVRGAGYRLAADGG